MKKLDILLTLLVFWFGVSFVFLTGLKLILWTVFMLVIAIVINFAYNEPKDKPKNRFQ